MTYLTLYITFFISTLFAFGGGLAIIPFLKKMITDYQWFNEMDLSTIIALSELTPGAIGVNMGTYAGFLAGGFYGAAIATLGVITPSIIIVSTLARLWKKIKTYPQTQSTLNAIKSSVTGLIFSIFVSMLASLIHPNIISEQNLKTIGLFLISFMLIQTKKLPIIVMILTSAVLGILLNI